MMHEALVGKKLRFKDDVAVFQFQSEDAERSSFFIKLIIMSNAVLAGKKDYNGPFVYARLTNGAADQLAANEEAIVIPAGCTIDIIRVLRKGGVLINVWGKDIDREQLILSEEIRDDATEDTTKKG